MRRPCNRCGEKFMRYTGSCAKLCIFCREKALKDGLWKKKQNKLGEQ